MEIQGRIIAVLAPVSGVSQKTGNAWAKQEYVLETREAFPKRICFTVFGEEKIRNFALREGEEVTVSIDISSREYNGKWYTDITAWGVLRTQPGAQGAPQGAPQGAQYGASQGAPQSAPIVDDLPF